MLETVKYSEKEIKKNLLEYKIGEEEVDNWKNAGVSDDNIYKAIKYVQSTNQRGKNFSGENANAIRQAVALIKYGEKGDQYAFIPIIKEEKPNFLKYTRGLRGETEGKTYRTETDMSVMIAVIKKTLADSIESKQANFQYTDKEGQQKNDTHTYEVLRTEKGNFVLVQPVENDNFKLKLILEIKDFKNSGQYGQDEKEEITFLVPATSGGHWTLGACTVSFPECEVKEQRWFNSSNDRRQKDGWSCGIHTMEAAYSLITGEKLETANGKNIQTLYNDNISEAKKEKLTDYTCMSDEENKMVQKALATSYVEYLKEEYVRSVKDVKSEKVENILKDLEIEKNINSYSKDLLEDKDFMKDIIGNIIQAHEEKSSDSKEIINNAKEIFLGR